MACIRERRFDKLLEKLDPEVQAWVVYAINNPHERQYRLCQLAGGSKGKLRRKHTWRIRVTDQDWRAMAQKVGNDFHWYWVGRHPEYDKQSQ